MTIKAHRPVVVHGGLSLSPGEVADVPDHIAQVLIVTGKVSRFTPPPVPPVEVAAVQPVAETAAAMIGKQTRRIARKS